MTGTATTIMVVPANEASWKDLQAVLGTRGYHSGCWCQRFKIRGRDWDSDSVPVGERANRLRKQTHCGQPEADTTSGLVAYLDGEPAGWCAVSRAPPTCAWAASPGRGERRTRPTTGVWAVTCFVTRTGFRRRGVSRALARAAVDFARQRGARALEGYPMITQPGHEITWGELHVGSRSIFAAAGFTEVSRPTLRRVVMRIDF